MIRIQQLKQAFTPVRHKDLNRSNNRVDNLRWCSRSETIQSAFDRGTKQPARCIPVRVIETGKEYYSIRECARDLDIWQTEISKCLLGKLSHVKGYHFEYV